MRELQAALAWLALPGVGEQTLLALLRHARESRRSLAELWVEQVADLRAFVRLHPRTVAALESRARECWRRAEEDSRQIRERGLDVFLWGDPEYPAAFRRPGCRERPLVFAYGAVGLLEEPRVALLNSNAVSNAGLVLTDALADGLARRDTALVASTNRESYQAAATAAKRHAGPALLVLDRTLAEAVSDGLTREPVAAARVWDTAFDPNLQLLLSAFGWREPWTQRSGSRRDAFLCDLADVLVAVEVRPGGIMDRELRRAARAGKPVLALDQGDATPEGTRGLWEEEPRVTRLPWKGGDAAADEVLRRLPEEARRTAAEQPHLGTQREVGRFLARACDLLSGQLHCPDGPLGVYPPHSPLGHAASAWRKTAGDATSGAAWLLADLFYGGEQPPVRPAQLLRRVARGGLLALVVPAEWLTEPEHAASRAVWLDGAGARLIARLPAPAFGDASLPAGAAVILQRDGEAGPEAPVFSPGPGRMGRFHLRRYLQEILQALSGKNSG